MCQPVRELARTSNGQGLIARQQFSLFAEYKHRHHLVTVAAEFVSDDPSVGFSRVQRRELFTDVIRQQSAMVLGLEESGPLLALLQN